MKDEKKFNIGGEEYTEMDLDRIQNRIQNLINQDVDMEFLHTYYFSKFVSMLNMVKFDQKMHGANYAFDNTPYEECNYVEDAINEFESYVHYMKTYHLEHYYPMDIALIKKLGVKDTFYAITAIANKRSNRSNGE